MSVIRAWCRQALVLGLTFAVPAASVSAQAPHARVPDWAGAWEGELVNIPPTPGARPVRVVAEIGAFPTADATCSTLRNTYREQGEVKGVKDYRLCRGSGPDDLFIDEGNGIKLTARLLDGALVTPFKYGSTLLVSTMTLRGDLLVEEILSIADKPATDGPQSLQALRIQRLTLRRVTGPGKRQPQARASGGWIGAHPDAARPDGTHRRRSGADGLGDEQGALKMHVVTTERSIVVAAGEGIDLAVPRPVGIPEQLQHEWPDAPSVEGEAVRFVRRWIEVPPSDVDGGVATLHYEFEAVLAGAARVVLVPRPASREAARPPIELDVTVRARAAPASARGSW